MRLSGKLFAACGLWMVLLGIYFVLLRPALLPEDPRFMGTSIEALRAAAPGLEGWLGNVFNVMGGFMAAAGTMTILVPVLLWLIGLVCYLREVAPGGGRGEMN